LAKAEGVYVKAYFKGLLHANSLVLEWK